MRKNARNRATYDQLTREQRQQLEEELRTYRFEQTAGDSQLNEEQLQRRRAAQELAREHKHQLTLREQRRREIQEAQNRRIEDQIRAQQRGLHVIHREVPDREGPPGDLRDTHNIRAGDVVIYNERGGTRLEVNDVEQDPDNTFLYPRGIVVGFTRRFVRVRTRDDSIINREYQNVRTYRRPSNDEHRSRWQHWGYGR